MTTAAIRGLGEDPSAKRIAAVVYAAVRAVPDRTLDVVRAALLSSSKRAVNDIIVAAVSAVPDPWKRVMYRKMVAESLQGERDFKGAPDFKGDVRDSKKVVPTELPLTAGLSMTLAEAIMQTALEVWPDLNRSAMLAAVEVVLQTAPGVLIGAISDPRGISGVGDAGNNNYANEPRRRTPASLAPKPGTSGVNAFSIRIPATPAPVSP